MATTAKPKQPTYSWILDPHECFICPESYQTVTGLWETAERATFHDAELAQATQEINGILSRVEKRNKDKSRKLSFIEFQNRQFLVWARYGVGQWDEDKTVIKELKLKK
jgi:hypothetical protein